MGNDLIWTVARYRSPSIKPDEACILYGGEHQPNRPGRAKQSYGILLMSVYDPSSNGTLQMHSTDDDGMIAMDSSIDTGFETTAPQKR